MGGFSTLALAAIALMLALHSASADYPAPTYSVSLDAAADTRWDAAIRGQVKTHGWDGTFGAVEDYMNSWIEPSLAKILAPLLDGLLKDMPGDYGNEVTGVWNSINAIKPASSNLTLGHIIAMNLIYEFSCTSIVAQDSVGNVFHGRNLDYPIPGLSNSAFAPVVRCCPACLAWCNSARLTPAATPECAVPTVHRPSFLSHCAHRLHQGRQAAVPRHRLRRLRGPADRHGPGQAVDLDR